MSIRCGCKRRLKRRQKSRLVLRYLFRPHSNSERHTYRLAFRTRSITASPTHRLMSVRRKHSRQLSPHIQHLIRPSPHSSATPQATAHSHPSSYRGQRHIYAAPRNGTAPRTRSSHSNESPSAPGFAVTLIAAPSENFPSSSSFASGFSTYVWIARLTGRAPNAGS